MGRLLDWDTSTPQKKLHALTTKQQKSYMENIAANLILKRFIKTWNIKRRPNTPYIKTEERNKWKNGIAELVMAMHDHGITPGDLNYIYTKLAHHYIQRKGLNYTHLNDIVGVFESAKAEFQRRVVNPYEISKIEENGDL